MPESAAFEERLQRRESCPVCGSDSLFPFRSANFATETIEPDDIKITDKAYGSVWDLERCRDCTHVFANPCPTPGFISSLYADIVDPQYQEESEGREKNFERILNYLEKCLPEKGPLFDVGAATGILLNMAQERGWETAGIEPSLWAVRTARDNYGLELSAGDFETAQLPDNRYAAVTMIDFIEHVPDPLPALLKAGRILRPGGILCLVTPDIHSVAARMAGKRWWHYRPAHLAYFTRRSLNALLVRADFSPVKIRRYTWTFSAHYLLSRLVFLNFLLKNPRLALFWRRIPIKLALGDSFELYAGKKNP
jgi:SAM-dependent methyltransferase